MGFFSNLFGKRETLPPLDLSFLRADMHSHLIPGIDDGAKNLDESIALLAKFESMGFEKVITTPHIMSDYYRNTPDTILRGLGEVQEMAHKLNLRIEVEAAAEYYFDESLLARLDRKERLLTFGDNYVLFEFSFHSEPNQVDKLIFDLLTQDYKPVLAHFERYAYLEGAMDRAAEWRAKGVNIQMNLNSLGGHYGPAVMEQAKRLVDAELIDFVGSDCHRMDHLMTLESYLTNPYFHKLVDLPLKNSSLLKS